MALQIAGCGGSPAPPAGSLVVGIESQPTSLDPRTATDASSTQVLSLVHRGLTVEAPDGVPRADLAESWETPDARTVRFRLGPATFQDGSPVRAEDVVATYRSLTTPAFRGMHQEDLGVVDRVTAEDERTVRFDLREPFAPFLHATTLAILPAACARGDGECLIGCGPFRIASRDVDSVTLVASSTAETAPGVPAIVFRASPDATSRALGLARGTIDLVQNGVEPDLLPWLAARGLRVTTTPGSTFQYLGLNLRRPALADPRVRLAIGLAIDRRGIVEHLFGDTARLAEELFPPGHWAHAGVEALPYDPERARSLLVEAGSLPLRLRYKTSTVEQRRRVAEAIAFDLGRVGIEVELQPLEWAALYGDIRRGNFELFSLAWVGVQDPDHFYGWLHSSMTPPRGNNRGGYSSPLVDSLTEEARTTLSRERRLELYGGVAAETRRDLPFIPLWWLSNVVVQTPRLQGFTPSPSGDLRGLARARWAREPGATDAGT